MKRPSTGTKILVTILVLFGLLVVASFSAGVIMLFGDRVDTGNVAVIPVEGVLMAGTGRTPAGVVTSDQLIDDLDRAEEASSVEAIVLLVNSPGGSAVASEEVARRVARAEKPVVTVIREVGASGAYWVASATERVVASPMSVTGSIGVIGSYLSFGDFLDDWNVTHNRLVAGDWKDVGTPLRELDDEERAFLQGKLDAMHELFIDAVAENRNLTRSSLEPVADGRFLLGQEALDLGLVDELGGKEAAFAYLTETHDIEVDEVLYEHTQSLLDILASAESSRLAWLVGAPRAESLVGVPRT